MRSLHLRRRGKGLTPRPAQTVSRAQCTAEKGATVCRSGRPRLAVVAAKVTQSTASDGAMKEPVYSPSVIW